MELDTMSTRAILELLNDEDAVAVAAARDALPAVAELIEGAEARVRAGGRVHYFGAGTSGRLGVLDAAELVPTFGIDPSLVRAWIAGGHVALVTAVEGSEDSEHDGESIVRDEVAGDDVVIGLAVSGTTPYVRGALRAARQRGALTALITSNPDTPLAVHCDHLIVADTGPEVVTGSTRLKAGTATKLLLNAFSTALMVRLGRTHSNLMVSVLASNEKLRKRTLRILGEVTGGTESADAELLDSADGDLRVAVLSHLGSVPVSVARVALAKAEGSISDALTALTAPGREP
jgi:N-acetylmuramic acid 6-phosphate etherase